MLFTHFTLHSFKSPLRKTISTRFPTIFELFPKNLLYYCLQCSEKTGKIVSDFCFRLLLNYS